MTRLSNKVALITGASSGIGRAAARMFADEGAKLVLTARRGAELAELVQEIAASGGEAIAVPGDVRNEAHMEKVVAEAVGAFGKLDIAFNNAGYLADTVPVTEFTTEEWRKTIDTNLTSAFFGAKYQAQAMQTQGSGVILFTSSFVGSTAGFGGYAAYGAAKAGLVGFMKLLAVELGEKNIRVNALLPGATETPMNVASRPDADPGMRDFIHSIHALGRMAAPEEIASAALYLASDAASFITGTALLVDGGVSVKRG